MDLTDQIDTYLEAKKYSPNSMRANRGVLLDFNKYQMNLPAATMSEKANRYGQYVRERLFLKPKTAERRVSTVRRFCGWLEETGRVSAFRLDEQLLGRAEFLKVPESPVGEDEIVRMMNVASVNGRNGVRDAAMMLLAVTCGLTATEISSLDASAAEGFGSGGELRYCGKSVRIPGIASRVIQWYTRDRRPDRGSEPLFTEDDGRRMAPGAVETRVSALLDVVGVSYRDAVPGDPQLRIAQHFKELDEAGRRLAALHVQAESYADAKIPKRIVKAMVEGVASRRGDADGLVDICQWTTWYREMQV